MKTTAKILFIIALLFLSIGMIPTFVRTVEEKQFNNNCTVHIKSAVKAESVEEAKKELEEAISYAEKNGLTEGNTGVFSRESKNDIGLWYQNILAAYKSLEEIPYDANNMEKNYTLMNLRNILMYEKNDKFFVILPERIGTYPNNTKYFMIEAIASCTGIILSVATLLATWQWDKKRR